jgi:hypothetical protein
MRAQWELLLGLFLINISMTMVMALGLPGTSFLATGTTGTIDVTTYQQQLTKIEGWGGNGNPLQGIPVIGDIFGGFMFLTQNIQFLIAGLPTFLTYISNTYITDPTAQLSFQVIAVAITAIYLFLIGMFFVEFISGRVFTD